MQRLRDNTPIIRVERNRPEVSPELHDLILRRQDAWSNGSPPYVTQELTRLIKSTRKKEKKRQAPYSARKELDVRA
eukprot:12916487-Prorocentrum_lima.AAC.1